jgi:hypothetical protein
MINISDNLVIKSINLSVCEFKHLIESFQGL